MTLIASIVYRLRDMQRRGTGVLTLEPKVRTLVRGDASLSPDGPSGVARHRAAGTRPVVGPSTPGRPLSRMVVIPGTEIARGRAGVMIAGLTHMSDGSRVEYLEPRPLKVRCRQS
jgi:hypothetical protein